MEGVGRHDVGEEDALKAIAAGKAVPAEWPEVRNDGTEVAPWDS